jgi:hypothetical protein
MTGSSYCAQNVQTYASALECANSFCANFPNNTFPIGSAPIQVSAGNSRECRLYHAQVGVQTSSVAHCTHATPLSVIGTCVTSDTAYTSDGNAATATYCDNHIRICGTISTNPTYGMWASVAQCKQVAPKFKPGLKNAQSGNSLDSRNYHVNVAGSSAANQFHCQHSGVNGKQFCTDSNLAVNQALGCDSFCEQNMAICNGTNTQFATIGECVRFCTALPAATEAPYPTAGDSLQCRFYHLQVAAQSASDAATHCPHTGFFGGDGVCGTAAEAMCDIEIAACNKTGDYYNSLAQYSSKTQCVAASTAFPRDLTGTVASPVISGNSLECRHYHSQVSLQSSSQATAHCYHTGALGGAGVCGTACAGFCSTVMQGCNATVGGMQFTSEAACLTNCATWPVGTLTMPAAVVSGNSLACRAYHAGVALSGDASTKNTHCPHAAAFSGSQTCGTYCESYCNTIQAACTGNLTQFASTASCLSACGSYATSGLVTDTTGATVQCRAYHAGVALTGTYADKQTHCPHAGQNPTSFCVVNGVSSSAVSSWIMIATAMIAAVVAKRL